MSTTKRKAKKKAAPKKTTKKKADKKKADKKTADKKTKPVDLAKVRQEIRNLVGNAAAGMVKAAVNKGKNGQLAPVKYMFEVAGLYPAAEGTEGTAESNSLARFLLKTLGLPEAPPQGDEDESWMRLQAGESKPGTDSLEEPESEEAASRDESDGAKAHGNNPVRAETIP